MNGHYYDWQSAFSTDPAWDAHRRVKITCNGTEFGHVARCLAGQMGFVEVICTDSDGHLMWRKDGHGGATVLTELRMGKVVVTFDAGDSNGE